jgi:hypothetical protein
MKVARRRMAKHTERRKHSRFQVENVLVATLGKSKVGIITEISKGGMLFDTSALIRLKKNYTRVHRK